MNKDFNSTTSHQNRNAAEDNTINPSANIAIKQTTSLISGSHTVQGDNNNNDIANNKIFDLTATL